MKNVQHTALKAASLSVLLAAPTANVVHAQDLGGDEFNEELILEEIVVTARKRQETLQQTPVAVTALSAEAIKEKGIATVRDLQQAAPGLSFTEQGTKNPSIFIRGVGQRESLVALDPGVGVYINNIYIPRTDSQLFDTLDVQSVEILRGPQGTLFGKNNTGGAILLNTKLPHSEGVEGEASTRLGNFGRRDAKVSANLPITDDLAARVAVNSVKRDGYMDNVAGDKEFGDEDRLSAMGRVVWEASRAFTVDGFAYYAKQNENGAAFNCIPLKEAVTAHENGQIYPANINMFELTGTGDADPRADFTPACMESNALAKDNKVSLNDDHSVFKMTSSILSATLTWDLDDYQVRSTTAWSNQGDIEVNDDQDGTALPFISNGLRGWERAIGLNNNAVNTLHVGNLLSSDDETRDQYSQELVITGYAFDESLTYTVGAFAAMERIRNSPFSQFLGDTGYLGLRYAGTPGALRDQMLGFSAEPSGIGAFLVGTGYTSAENLASLNVDSDEANNILNHINTVASGAYGPEAQAGANAVLANLGQLAALMDYGVDLNSLLVDTANEATMVSAVVPKFLGGTTDIDNETYALFAQGEYDVNDWFKLTLGARYTSETRERSVDFYTVDTQSLLMNPVVNPNFGDGIAGGGFFPAGSLLMLADPTFGSYLNNILENSPGFLPLTPLEGDLDKSKTWSKFTPMANLSFTVPDELLEGSSVDSTLMYVTWSKGFKAGGFEPKGAEMLTFEPEEVTNYELGVKLDSFDHRLRFNTALYRMTYENIQTRVASSGENPGDIFLYITNAGQATIQGVEMEMTAILAEGLNLLAFVNYTDAAYDEFIVQEADAAGNVQYYDRSDDPLGSVAPLTYSLGLSYDWKTDAGLVVPSVTTYYRDEVYVGLDADSADREETYLDDYSIWNARVAYIPANTDSFEAAVFVHNLLDEDYYQGGFATTTNMAAALATQGAPRTYGVELSYLF